VPSLVVIVLIESVPLLGEPEEWVCSAAAKSAVYDRLAAARTPVPPIKRLRREVAVKVEVVRSFIESPWSWSVANQRIKINLFDRKRQIADIKHSLYGAPISLFLKIAATPSRQSHYERSPGVCISN
jgi:hypothetical protein